jgi:hypothetical protein
MATKGERKALAFLAAVAVLGAGTRALRSRPVATQGDDDGLTAQLAAVDSLREGKERAARAPRGGASRGRSARGRSRVARTPVEAASPIEPTVPSPPSWPAARARVDVDVAPVEAIDGLPGVGPVIAARIVLERTANGPFGCLAALDVVKGIGPALLRRLDTLVSFSGRSRRSPDPCARAPAPALPRLDRPLARSPPSLSHGRSRPHLGTHR